MSLSSVPSKDLAEYAEKSALPPWTPGLRRCAWAIVLLAIGLRAAWGLLVPVVPISDAHAYDIFAQNLAAGGCYGWDPAKPQAYWPVGTSFLYSLAYRLCHPATCGYGAAVILNLVAGVAIVVLSIALASRWFGARVAVTTGALLAVWPMHIEFTTLLASESFFTGLCLAGILAWPHTHFRSTGGLVLAAALFAAACYFRPTALLIPFLLAGADWLRRPCVGRLAARSAIVAVVMAAIIAPWTMRNYRIFGQVVLISTNAGRNLWMGNNPKTTGAYQDEPPQPAELNEAQFDRAMKKEAIDYIKAEPVAFVKRTLVKAVRVNERETIGVVWNKDGLKRVMPQSAITALKITGQAFWLGMVAASLIGVFVLIRTRGLWQATLHPTVLIWAYFTAVHAVIVFQDRYHFPATPMVGALAALATSHTVWRPKAAPRKVRA